MKLALSVAAAALAFGWPAAPMPDDLNPAAVNVASSGEVSPSLYPHTLAQHYVTAQLAPATPAEQDLFTDLIAQNTLADAGMSLRAQYAGHFTGVGPGSNDRRVRLRIAQLGPPVVLFDSTALTPGAPRDWTLDVYIIREASGTDGRARAVWTDSPTAGGAGVVRSSVVEFSLIADWFQDLNLVLSGQATGGLNAVTDVRATLGFLEVLDKVRP